MPFSIIHGSESDACDCLALQRSVSLRLGKGNGKDGFLLDLESEERFRKYFTEGSSLIVREEGILLGFLVGYSSSNSLFPEMFNPDRVREIDASNLFPDKNSFYIEKIAVSLSARRRGIARSLYDELIVLHPTTTFYACIVEAPSMNEPSRQLHQQLAFQKLGTFEFISTVGDRVVVGVHERRPF